MDRDLIDRLLGIVAKGTVGASGAAVGFSLPDVQAIVGILGAIIGAVAAGATAVYMVLQIVKLRRELRRDAARPPG